jgi:hypothetical protein
MTPLIVIISTALILSVVLLWIATAPSRHVTAKISLSAVLVLAGVAIWWVYSYDRPILQPQIGGVVTQNFNGTQFALDIEALVKNSGRQSGYADTWKLLLSIDGTEMQGKQLYGQPLPNNAVNEPELYNQEFPSGKPARGWLFFGFPAVSHDYAAPYFFCNSSLTEKVSLKLSVWDSKSKHEWSQVRSLKDLGKEACMPLAPLQPVSSVNPNPRPRRVAHEGQSESPAPTGKASEPQTPSLIPQQQPCIASNCINGPNFGNPTVINPLPLERTWRLSISDCDVWVKKLDSLGTTKVSVGWFISDNDGARIGQIIIACFNRSTWRTTGAVLPVNPDGVLIGASSDGPNLDVVAEGLGSFGLRVNRKRDIRPAYGDEIGIVIGTNPIAENR